MEIVNATPFPVLVERNVLGEERMDALVVCGVTSQVAAGREGPGLALHDEQRPLERQGRDFLGDVTWHKRSVSVCATGFVYSFQSDRCRGGARLTVGGEKRTVDVFGPRAWVKGISGRLVPSEPRPFERVEMSWRNAYGGMAQVATRLIEMEGREVVVPGHASPYADNPAGKGYHVDAATALGAPLPDIEDPDRLVQRWDDRPEPVGFAPYPLGGGLRRHFLEEMGIDLTRPLVSFPRLTPEAVRGAKVRPEDYAALFSKAAPATTFPEVPAGTVIALAGMRRDRAELRFTVPEPPIAVRVLVAGTRLRPPVVLDAIDIDAEAAAVRFLFRARFDYPLVAHDRRRVIVTMADVSLDEEDAT